MADKINVVQTWSLECISSPKIDNINVDISNLKK